MRPRAVQVPFPATDRVPGLRHWRRVVLAFSALTAAVVLHLVSGGDNLLAAVVVALTLLLAVPYLHALRVLGDSLETMHRLARTVEAPRH